MELLRLKKFASSCAVVAPHQLFQQEAIVLMLESKYLQVAISCILATQCHRCHLHSTVRSGLLVYLGRAGGHLLSEHHMVCLLGINRGNLTTLATSSPLCT